jgi:hypothetical protein
MPDTFDPPVTVRHLARDLATPRPMRRGTFSVQYLKCNKPGCACATDPAGRHGPYYRVVRVVGGQTQAHHVPVAHADVVRQQVAAGHTFRQQVEAYWQACEAWADAELGGTAAAPEAAEKGGSRRPSPRRSRPKSRR